MPSRPIPGNKYYNKTPTGYSTCIIGNYPKGGKRTGYPGLDTLPNCVAYSLGYLNESNGRKQFDMLLPTDAGRLISVARAKGYGIADYPTQGGIMVWAKSGGAGHCAVVKHVLSDTAVITSESEWNGSVYAEYARHKGDGNWRDGCYWMRSNYTFLGCIRNPVFEVENMTIDELIDNMTPEQAYRLSEKAMSYSDTLPVSNYAKIACEEAVSAGIAADGNKDGSVDKPRSPLLRQEFFVILKRMGLLK